MCLCLLSPSSSLVIVGYILHSLLSLFTDDKTDDPAGKNKGDEMQDDDAGCGANGGRGNEHASSPGDNSGICNATGGSGGKSSCSPAGNAAVQQDSNPEIGSGKVMDVVT
jgi:hypothetical protein